MIQWTGHPVALALASALLHFLWQGAALALLALLIWRVIRPSAAARYVIGVATLAAMLAAPIVTVVWLAGAAPDHTAFAPGVLESYGTGSPARWPATAATVVEENAADLPASEAPFVLPGRSLILPLWLAGVLVLSGRLLGGWIVARRLTRRIVSPVRPEIAVLAARVANRLTLDRAVRIFESSVVQVPVMIGWLKPVILIPTAVLTSLTPAQIEALLAHELAHIRRHDYLVNLLQSAVETLLFYHPAVWWMSRRVRAEREQCCDDVAVSVCDRVTYVTALTDLAALGARPRLALAATDGSLLVRVRRLLGPPHADRPSAGAWLPMLLLALSATGFLPAVMASPVAQEQVAGGVEGGTPGGVTGGVPGGIEGGVPQGVAGGVAGGVPEGIASGVAAAPSGGVPRGVRGGVPAARQAAAPRETSQEPVPAPSEARAVRARRAELLTLLAREQEASERYLQQQGEIEQRRLALELEALQKGFEAAGTEQEMEIQSIGRELDRVRAQIEVGMARPEEREQLQKQLLVAQARLAATRVERETRLKQAMLQIEAARQKLAYEKRQLEIELARRRLELDADAAARNPSVMVPIEPTADDTVAADQNAPIAAGDVLVVEIAGEPALPRAYRVEPDGTIDLPLLGRVDAGGRTAAQVQEQIRRMLVESRLKPDAKVTVTRRQAR